MEPVTSWWKPRTFAALDVPQWMRELLGNSQPILLALQEKIAALTIQLQSVAAPKQPRGLGLMSSVIIDREIGAALVIGARLPVIPAYVPETELSGDFPADERFGLTNQMRGAAVSISSNIAVGSSRMSRTDFARFVEIATGLLFEVVSQTTIALRRKLLGPDNYNRIYAAAEKHNKMLSGLRRSLSQT